MIMLIAIIIIVIALKKQQPIFAFIAFIVFFAGAVLPAGYYTETETINLTSNVSKSIQVPLLVMKTGDKEVYYYKTNDKIYSISQRGNITDPDKVEMHVDPDYVKSTLKITISKPVKNIFLPIALGGITTEEYQFYVQIAQVIE